MDGTAIRAGAATYDDRQPFATVERERLETLPEAFQRGEFVWKDAEWVVRWYARRSFAPTSHPAEDDFGANRFTTIQAAIERAHDALEDSRLEDAIDALTELEGVTFPVGTAFLQFLDPDAYLVLDRSFWTVLRSAGHLDRPPEQWSLEAYERYLEACRTLASHAECDLWTVYRALWVETQRLD